MTLARAFAFILVMEIFCMAVRPTTDPDMWWHLRTGELIFAQGIPRHDTFSFTAHGHDLIAHEWASQALMWTIYSAGGLGALAVAFALLPAFAFALVYRSCEGRPYVAGAVVTLAAFAAAPWYGVKPQLFNLLFLATFVLVLERARQAGTPRLLMTLPLVTVAWANLHSGYLAGISLLLVLTTGDAIDLALGRRPFLAANRRDVQLLSAVAVACLVAAVLNPNGIRLVGYAVDTLRTPAFREHIAEWRSPDLGRPIYWPFAALVVVTAAVLARAPRRPTAAEALLVLGTAAAGLASARHVPIFAVVAPPIVARHAVAGLERRRAGIARPVLEPSSRVGPVGPAIVVAAVLLAAFWSAAKLRDNATIIASTYPVAAVDFLERSGLDTARGYNPYDWGGYLIWRRIPVFIDGRADVYGAPFFEYHLKTALAADDWSVPLDDQGCTYALVKRDGAEAAVLQTNRIWCERYADSIARVFVRCATPR